jgi:hypothetical protein
MEWCSSKIGKLKFYGTTSSCSFHCILSSRSTACENLKITQAREAAAKMVNFIRSGALNRLEFIALFGGKESEHKIIYHQIEMWLTRDRFYSSFLKTAGRKIIRAKEEQKN